MASTDTAADGAPETAGTETAAPTAPEQAAPDRNAVAPAVAEQTTAERAADGAGRPADGGGQDLAGLEAGLDALDTVEVRRTPVREILLGKVLPPTLAVLLVLVVWQLLVWGKVAPDYKLPSPHEVWQSLDSLWLQGTLFSIIWTSVSRGLLGFVAALVIGTPLGLLVARVKWVRASLGPLLTGLQSLPSVAWVPAAVIWLGLTSKAMYAVILFGAVPSIANGLVSGIDQVPPLYLRAGRTIGATGLRGAWHILLPAALPGYLAGLKQGWAFSWRSLMAAELIAVSPELGMGLGTYLENARTNSDMPGVLLGILLILFVGIAIDLLIFSPVERRVLRSRGLVSRNQ